MTRCTHHRLDNPAGLCCSLEEHAGNGHVYLNSTGSEVRGAHGEDQADE